VTPSPFIPLPLSRREILRRVKERRSLSSKISSPSPFKERGIKVEDSSRGEVDKLEPLYRPNHFGYNGTVFIEERK